MKKFFKLLINLALIQTGFCMAEQDVIDDLRREQKREREIEIHKKTDGDHLSNSLPEDERKRDIQSPKPKTMRRSRSGGYGSSNSADSWSEY